MKPITLGWDLETQVKHILMDEGGRVLGQSTHPLSIHRF